MNTFIFESYRFNKKTQQAIFCYAFDNQKKFTEIIDFSKYKINWQHVNQKLLDQILFNTHLILGIGYYKAYCPKKIIIKSGKLNKSQAEFWNKTYTKGLGEFFYRNKIDFRGLINFPYQKTTIKPIIANLSSRVLATWGGGKDSCVALKKLQELNHDVTLLSLRDSTIQKATAKIAKTKRIIIGREIDPQLFKLNEQGVYNGHVPISMIFTWTGLLAAVLYNYKYLVFANEASADYGNVKYLGEEINHQYSKSWEFENDLKTYLEKYVSLDLQCFSILRSYPELKIAEEFAKLKQYFPVFSSCNSNFKITNPQQERWCNHCPKCVFVFTLLSAFLNEKELLKIFSKNLYNEKSLLPIFQELWGEKNFKPFECVGTADEVKTAVSLAIKNKTFSDSYIIKYFKKHHQLKTKIIPLSPKNNLPLNFQKILLLGFGKEGHFAYQYLRDQFPQLTLFAADQKKIITSDKNLKTIKGTNNLPEFDLIIKTQGIPINTIKNSTTKITTITNIFLDKKSNATIGVTGTKGKSTTASLIYAILQAAKKPSYLVGNIGNDPLELIAKNATFVYELSSYQLETATKSPHIAVFINTFPDHLNYHGNYKNYVQAKNNISKYQTKDDCLIHNTNFNDIKTSKSKALAYNQLCKVKDQFIYYKNEKILPLKDIKLPGDHNISNIMAAIIVAKLLKIPNQAITKAIKNFQGLKHRLEFVGKYQGINFYDDAISTTPESTLMAITYLKKDLETIFLGGLNRGYNFLNLAKTLKAIRIKNIVLFPDSGNQIKQAILKVYQHKNLPNFLETKSMIQAVKFAKKYTKQNKTCLLSTASPSYSIFKNFEDKGDQYQAAIKS